MNGSPNPDSNLVENRHCIDIIDIVVEKECKLTCDIRKQDIFSLHAIQKENNNFFSFIRRRSVEIREEKQ